MSPEAVSLGLFGGTFDPPHNGHLLLARAARTTLALDRVLWVVTADPPHKPGAHLTPVADRLDMVRAAIEAEPGFEISRVDIDRPGPHWAVDTVALVANENPGVELVYIMGSDSLRDLPTWGRPQELLARCTLGVLRRPGEPADLAALERVLPGISARVRFIDVPPIEVASHAIRQRVCTGQPITGLVPPRVEAMILARGLYRQATTA